MPTKPAIFIGSSSEGRHLAEAIQASLVDVARCKVWTQGIFGLGDGTLDGLKCALDSFQFAILILSPDDEATIRGELMRIPRDNIVFELGLFLGRHPANRVFFLCPSIGEFRLPTDLAGITHGTYDPEWAAEEPRAATGPFCLQVRESLERWSRSSRVIAGPLVVRNLYSIGGEGEPHPADDVIYEFTDAEIRINSDRVEISASVRMSGRLQGDGRLEGHGDFFNGTAFIVYSIISDTPPFAFKGVSFLRISNGNDVAGYWISDDSSDPNSPRLAVGDAELHPAHRDGVNTRMPTRPVSRDRRAAIPGRWRGNVQYQEEPGALAPQTLELTLSLMGDRIVGHATVAYADKAPASAEFTAEGSLQLSRFVYLKFKSKDPAALHFGTLLTELDATGTTLNGALLAYGARANSVVTARVDIRRDPLSER